MVTQPPLRGGTAASTPEGETLVPRVAVPAVVSTGQALDDEAAALDRVDALHGAPTVEHPPDAVGPVAPPVGERLRQSEVALDRVDELAAEQPPGEADVEVTIALPAQLHRQLLDEAARRGVEPAQLHVEALRRLLS